VSGVIDSDDLCGLVAPDTDDGYRTRSNLRTPVGSRSGIEGPSKKSADRHHVRHHHNRLARVTLDYLFSRKLKSLIKHL
jgi:hypothetical protein